MSVNSSFINRLVGTSIVVIAAIVFIPNILDGEKVHYKELEKAGLDLYSRGGKIVGVQGFNRRYRLKTLGFDSSRISLEKTKKKNRLTDLKKIKSKKDIEQEL